MKKVEKVLLAAGILAFALVAWKMPWVSILWAVRGVGFGFVFILVQEVAAHILNTLGWWSAFSPEHRRMVPSFWRLFRLRIAGDAVGYLIPSAIVAGELAKATMIGEQHPIAARLPSLVVSKFTQTLAFALIFAGSLLLIAQRKVSLVQFENPVVWGIALLSILLLLLLALKVPAGQKQSAKSESEGTSQGWLETVKMIIKETLSFFREQPKLFLLSLFFFSLAYLWGAFEAYWIARFMGLPISVGTALSIEILSVSLDGLLFMVPAKAGSQELGKTAIFAALGLPKTAGFTFGLIRHTREILWALLGLFLFYQERGRAPQEVVTTASATELSSASIVSS